MLTDDRRHGRARYAVLDAARDYSLVMLVRQCSTEKQILFDGLKGDALSHVAPHLFACDADQNIAKIVLSGQNPGEIGILIDTEVDIDALRKHLRRFLSVQREANAARVYFRYYDPRVLRAFLPVCTPAELKSFFGPIEAFHCQDDEIGCVLTFHIGPGGRLVIESGTVADWLGGRSLAGRSPPTTS